MVWKNTGSISEKAADTKLVPIIGNAISPMLCTSALFENKPITIFGNNTKHIIPNIINVVKIIKENLITF